MTEIPTEHLQLQKIRASLEKIEKALQSLSLDALRVAGDQGLPRQHADKTLWTYPVLGSGEHWQGDTKIVKTLKTAKIDHGASGDNTIVSAVSGKRIKVYAVVLVVSGAVNCKWRSAATDLTGDMNFSGKGEGYAQAVQPPAFLLATNQGEALNLNLSGAVAVDGYVTYWDDDAS